MSLQKLDTLNLFTTQGLCQIELLVGDITQMTEEDKVDYLIVCTHPRSYYVRNEPLMKALQKNMNIMIDDHSQEPDRDLRKNYLCWLSKYLSPELPFSRLVCFERQADSKKPFASIRNIFRGLTPILDYRDRTAITNLLGTWNQFDRAQMLKTTVNAACNWMKVGLQLRCLKIVLCEKDSSNNPIDNEDCIEEFEKLKEKWTISKSFRFHKRYDVYISYSHHDEKKANVLATALTQANENLKIFCKPKAKCTKAWPEEAMVKIHGCKKFFALLTRNYMKNKDCLDDFMTAICYKNSLNDLQVISLCMETFCTLPPIIRNIPFIDCRLARGEKLTDKFWTVCEKMRHSFTISQMKSESSEDDNKEYDIYISYSESHWKEAEAVYKIMKRYNPTLNVFYDIMAIRNDNCWTGFVYKALEEVKCCILLVSYEYFRAKLCKEEFNVVVARRLLEKCEKPIAVIPVCISEFLFVPAWFGRLGIIDARNSLFQMTIEMLSIKLSQSFENNTVQEDFDWLIKLELEEDRCFKKVLHHYRNEQFCQRYFEQHANIVPWESPGTIIKPLSVVICFSTYDRRIAGLLVDIMQKEIHWLHVILLNKIDQDSFYHLQKADHIVMFVCEDYLSSADGHEILSKCLERQRKCRRRILHFACTSIIPDCLSYLQILPYSINFTDKIWGQMRKQYPGNGHITVNLKGVNGKFNCENFECMALEKLIQDIIISQQFRCSHPDEVDNILSILKISQEEDLYLTLDEVLVSCPREFQNLSCLSESLFEPN